MSDSLFTMAQNGTLPRFQYIDRETCDWIASQSPDCKDEHGHVVLPQSIQATLSLPLLPQFFADSRLVPSIHGVRHARRVAYYCYLIAASQGVDDSTAEKLVMAGLLHDIRRKDDKGDSGHGEASAQWFVSNRHDIERVWKRSFSESDVRIISTAIALHETPYGDISEVPVYKSELVTIAVDVIKTADALDRYRLPKRKWWINDSYLRCIPPDWLKRTAYDLVVASEYLCLETGKVDCVIDAITSRDNYAA